MTARSREKGSHAGRPRGYGLPFGVPGRPGPGTAASAGEPGEVRPRPENVSAPANAPAPGDARPPGGLPPAGGAPRSGGPARGQGSRHRKPPPERRSWLSGRQRLAVALILVIGVLAVGFADGFGSEASAEPTAQAFLLDWEQQQWGQAAALTTGGVTEVRDQLAAAYTDLDATNASFTMSRVTQHGNTAVATYTAVVDLAQGGQQWTYQGQFGLTASGGHWVVDWAPSVINPRLGAGDRLAVLTAFAPRAQVEDVDGQPLVSKSAVYRIGVHPGELKSPGATAAKFASRTGLDPQQVLDQIKAAPPGAFFPLLTLDPADFSAQWPKLAKVPGLSYQHGTGTLSASSAPDVVGQVGTEDDAVLRAEGAAYQPGTTVGVTGLEQAFQGELVGTPTTSVVVVDQAGHDVATLWKSPGGHAGTPVRTTLDSKQQAAAVSAVAGESNSAEIVAVDTGTGAIRALASRNVPGSPGLPKGGGLDAKVEPGMAFSIVSAAALLSAGVDAGRALPCESVADVGGETFTYQPATSESSTLATDFASGCGTAFANMSRTLTPQQLTSAERAFGIGASWQQLRLPGFSGSAPAVSGEAQVAAQATGTGGVLMSPLGMATVAAEVASGTGHSPVLLPADSSATWQAPVSGSNLKELRQLMRLAVTSGSAQAADLSGTPVYGQSGDVQSGKNSYLSWFVGYRGDLAVAVLETGSSASQAAAALAGTFLKAAG